MHPRFTAGEFTMSLIVLALFVIALAATEFYKESLLSIRFAHSEYGVLVYVALTVAATVLAPISTLPLLPVAVVYWGPMATAFLSIIGWTLGATIAYLIARAFGRPLVARMINLARAEHVAQDLAGSNLFVSLVIARILLPVDLLSYAVGLFLPMRMRTYVFATAIGVAPFAFIFSYTSALPLIVKGGIVLGAFAVLAVAFMRLRR